MDIQRLREVQSRERSTDSLQDLPESFYADVAAYVEELKAERERAAARADDPFDDPEVNRLSDEIDTAEQVAESIYERRVGKLVKQASFAAADMGGDDTGLTAEERDLYRDLVERIGENKSRVLDVLAGESDTDDGETAAAARPESAADSQRQPPERDPVDAASLMGDGSATRETGEAGDETVSRAADASAAGDTVAGTPPDAAEPGGGGSDSTPEGDTPRADAEPARAATGAGGGNRNGNDGAESDPATGTGADARTDPDAAESDRDGSGAATEPGTDGTERATVQVTRDVGEILGVDERVYDLESDDVVTLPAENAAPLVEKGAADRLD